jgi:hypothetical protein
MPAAAGEWRSSADPQSRKTLQGAREEGRRRSYNRTTLRGIAEGPERQRGSGEGGGAHGDGRRRSRSCRHSGSNRVPSTKCTFCLASGAMCREVVIVDAFKSARCALKVSTDTSDAVDLPESVPSLKSASSSLSKLADRPARIYPSGFLGSGPQAVLRRRSRGLPGTRPASSR